MPKKGYKQLEKHKRKISIGMIKFKFTKEELIEHYIKKKMSLKMIGKLYGCSDNTIKYKLVEYSIPRRSSSESREGMKLSEKHKQNISKNHVSKKEGYIHHNLGKHWKIKDTSNMGKGNNKGKHWKIKDTSNMGKGKGNKGMRWKIKDTSKWSFTNNGFKKGEDNIAKRSEIREKMRISAIEYIKNTEGQISPRQGRYEKKILDEIQDRIGFPIKRQFYINGYFLDGYCQILNLAIEIDEEHHYKNNLLRKRDLEKQDSIINTLKCNFLRIKVSKVVKDTNLNYKYIENQVQGVLN